MSRIIELEDQLMRAIEHTKKAWIDLANAENRLVKATKAIESAVEYANGRDSEWGERAETAFGFLRDYLKDYEDK
jgi:hypothetical protein